MEREKEKKRKKTHIQKKGTRKWVGERLGMVTAWDTQVHLTTTLFYQGKLNKKGNFKVVLKAVKGVGMWGDRTSEVFPLICGVTFFSIKMMPVILKHPSPPHPICTAHPTPYWANPAGWTQLFTSISDYSTENPSRPHKGRSGPWLPPAPRHWEGSGAATGSTEPSRCEEVAAERAGAGSVSEVSIRAGWADEVWVDATARSF